MQKEWFVIHTLTGQESKVRDSILKRLEQSQDGCDMREYVDEVVIPTEKVQEVKKGVRSTTTRKFFPGYVLVRIALYDENRQIVERSWNFVQETPGVIRMIGGGGRPVPLSQQEVDVVLNQIEEKREKVKPKVNFDPGETVKITDGPFMSFTGTVEEVDPGRGKLKVSVAIFGRSAPVELEYWQVEKAT